MLQNVWGSFIAWYLFLAGAGAGAYLVAAVADVLSTRHRLAYQSTTNTAQAQMAATTDFPDNKYAVFIKPGIYLGGPLVAIGSLLLLLDLGQPAKFMLGYLRPGSSMISIGIWIITIFMLCSFIHLGTLIFRNFSLGEKALKALEIIGGIFAIGTMAYTGLLLGVVKAIPFWNNPLIPVLFMVSAVSTGIAAVILVSILTNKQGELTEALHGLASVDIGLIVGELLMLLFIMVVMVQGNQVAITSAQFLISGGYAVVFWAGVIIIGLVVPLILEILMRRGNVAQLGVITSLCLLVGGICLRYSILAAGMPYPIG